jgi:hypothetical protein
MLYVQFLLNRCLVVLQCLLIKYRCHHPCVSSCNIMFYVQLCINRCFVILQRPGCRRATALIFILVSVHMILVGEHMLVFDLTLSRSSQFVSIMVTLPMSMCSMCAQLCYPSS